MTTTSYSCRTCAGTGFVPLKDPDFALIHGQVTERCPQCKGTGKVRLKHRQQGPRCWQIGFLITAGVAAWAIVISAAIGIYEMIKGH